MRRHLSKQEVQLPEGVVPPDPLSMGHLPQLKITSWAKHLRQARTSLIACSILAVTASIPLKKDIRGYDQACAHRLHSLQFVMVDDRSIKLTAACV